MSALTSVFSYIAAPNAGQNNCPKNNRLTPLHHIFCEIILTNTCFCLSWLRYFFCKTSTRQQYIF